MNITTKQNRFSAGFLLLAFVVAWLINTLSVTVILSFMGGSHNFSFRITNNGINIFLQHHEDNQLESLTSVISANDSHEDHQIFLPVLDAQLHKPVSHQTFKSFAQLIHFDNFQSAGFPNSGINPKKERAPPHQVPSGNKSDLKLKILKTIILLI